MATKAKAPAKTPKTKQAPVADALPLIPEAWPGAFGIYKYSKKAVMLNILPLVALFFGSYIVSFFIGIIFEIIPRVGYSLGQLASQIVAIFFSIAIYKVLLHSIRGKTADPIETLKASPEYFVKMVLAYLLCGAILVASFIALIVPFFFIAPRLVNVGYFILDKNMGVMDALKASWNTTDKNVGKVYGIVGAYIAYSLLYITIIGIPFAIYFIVMYSASTTVYYEYTSKQNPNPLEPKAA